MEADDADWMTAQQACDRLRIRPQTLYAYVSRGVLRRTRDGRRSRFAVADVEALAARTARGRRPGRAEITIETGITHLDPAGRLAFRGVEVGDLAGRWSFERTAEWLWSGRDVAVPAWAAPPEVIAVLRAGQALLPERTGTSGRVRAAVAMAGALVPTPDRRRDAAAIAAEARALLSAVVASLPTARRDPDPGSLAAQLWPALTGQPATPARVAALDASLVALADHELAASTLAVRVAASTWAAFPEVVLAGLGSLSGPLHGASADAVAALLVRVERHGAAASIAERRHGSELRSVPGFGHSVYRAVDPRFTALEPLVRAVATPRLAGAVEELRETMAGVGAHANVDLALGALARAGRWAPGAAEAVFGVARIAGWAAHAVEEYRYRLRFRPRAIYTGPRS